MSGRGVVHVTKPRPSIFRLYALLVALNHIIRISWSAVTRYIPPSSSTRSREFLHAWPDVRDRSPTHAAIVAASCHVLGHVTAEPMSGSA